MYNKTLKRFQNFFFHMYPQLQAAADGIMAT